MALLSDLILAVKEGSILAAAHFIIQCLTSGLVLAHEQFVYLASGYSLFFYVLNLCFFVSRQAPASSVPNTWLVYFSGFASSVFELAAVWFIIRHTTAFFHDRSTQMISNKDPSTHALYVNGSNEQQHIYWTVREIATNCCTHWRKRYNWGCHLEEGAPPEQVRKLDILLDVKLPNDYKTFLQLTNGLNNVLDGGKPHLTFLPADSPQIALSSVYENPSDEMRKLYAAWLVESLCGPGSRAELIEQTGYRFREYDINLVKIASRGNEPGGVFLVSPKDVRKTVHGWMRVAFHHPKRNGALIGRINCHVGSYFGHIGSELDLLKDWEEWLVLQVQEQGQGNCKVTRCRLYPSFLAFLQTLAEMSRRSTDNLLSGMMGEHIYADNCRLKWEWEWDRRLGDETRLIGIGY
ncbi:hypothetical protein F4680DRAFT_317108 [Xylaria scruposa]|nr:hypothetical protein F4680DRAFT_317108 [Xylaria scruposa]